MADFGDHLRLHVCFRPLWGANFSSSRLHLRLDKRNDEWLGLRHLRGLCHSGWHWARHPRLWTFHQHRSGDQQRFDLSWFIMEQEVHVLESQSLENHLGNMWTIIDFLDVEDFGLMQSDYYTLAMAWFSLSWGYAYSGLSGRVSHTLSLRGPCFTVDTACSATVRSIGTNMYQPLIQAINHWFCYGFVDVFLSCLRCLSLGRWWLWTAPAKPFAWEDVGNWVNPWRESAQRSWFWGRSAAASGVNLQLSAAIWVQCLEIPLNFWILAPLLGWFWLILHVSCFFSNQPTAPLINFQIAISFRLVLPKCAALRWTETARPLIPLQMALHAVRAWVSHSEFPLQTKFYEICSRTPMGSNGSNMCEIPDPQITKIGSFCSSWRQLKISSAKALNIFEPCAVAQTRHSQSQGSVYVKPAGSAGAGEVGFKVATWNDSTVASLIFVDLRWLSGFCCRFAGWRGHQPWWPGSNDHCSQRHSTAAS